MSDERFIEELTLTPEDFLKLNQILATAGKAIDTAREKLPLRIQDIIISADVTSDLREDESDRLRIEITFSLVCGPTESNDETVGDVLAGVDLLTTNTDQHDFEISTSDSRIFYVECLAENLAELVEQRFTETTKNFLTDYCNFLYKAADGLHELLNP